jgi:predicted AAA+ superfamily ATPase
MEYRKRIIDEQLSNALLVCGAVLIEGPRACGKTATAMQFAGSRANLDTDGDQRLIAENAPDVFLQGATPRLIDECQIVKSIWNHVRREVDNRQAVGQFILTGSAQK